MREITDHKTNSINEAITIHTPDNLGAGGASHEYIIGFGAPMFRVGTIKFQSGPINLTGLNGITNEALLAIVIDRLRGFQGLIPNQPVAKAAEGGPEFTRGKFACRENAVALTHLEEALMWLQKRTRDRMARGVEGVEKP